MNNHNQVINRPEVQIGQLANPLNERQKISLPSQPLPNLKNSFPINEAEDITPKQYNIVHILRSEKQVDKKVSNPSVSNNPVSNPHVITPKVSNDPSSSSISQPSTFKSNEKDKSAEQTHKPIVPFPNRLATNKTNAQMKRLEKCLIKFKQMCPFLMLFNKFHHMPNF